MKRGKQRHAKPATTREIRTFLNRWIERCSREDRGGCPRMTTTYLLPESIRVARGIHYRVRVVRERQFYNHDEFYALADHARQTVRIWQGTPAELMPAVIRAVTKRARESCPWRLTGKPEAIEAARREAGLA